MPTVIKPGTVSMYWTDRGHCDTWVLIPGWGHDHRIFSVLPSCANTLMVDHVMAPDMDRQILLALDQIGVSTGIRLMGFSMGAMVVLHCASQLLSSVSDIYLVGLRPSFPESEILFLKRLLQRSVTRGLNWFYTSAGRCEQWELLIGEWMDRFELNILIEALDRLALMSVSAAELSNLNRLQVFAGDQDQIAPLEQIQRCFSDVQVITGSHFDVIEHVSLHVLGGE